MAALAVVGVVGVLSYDLFLLGSAHVGLAAEFLAEDGLRVTYVMPAGFAYDLGVKPGDLLLEATGGEVLQGERGERLVNPSRVVVQRGEGVQIASASDMALLTPAEANVLRGLSLLFVVAGCLAILARGWEPSSWGLFVFLVCAGLLMGVAVFSGTRGGVGPVIASVGLAIGTAQGGVSWLSSFPHKSIARDWRGLASQVCLLIGVVVFAWAAISITVFSDYYFVARYLIAFYVALAVSIMAAELAYSARSRVPMPRRNQAKWLSLVFLLSFVPAVLLYPIPSLLGTSPLISARAGFLVVALLPVGILAVVMRYQMRNVGEKAVTWLLRCLVLCTSFAIASLTTSAFLGQLVGPVANANAIVYAVGGLAVFMVAATWVLLRMPNWLPVGVRDRVWHSDPGAELRIRDDERQRLLHELRDGPLQTAVALFMRMDAFKTGAVEKELVQRLIVELRALVSTSPVEHPRGRMAQAVSLLAQRVERFANIPIAISVTGQERFDRLSVDKGTALFHGVQEALSNAVRHADPSEIRMQLAGLDTSVLACIQDNGRGFDGASISWDMPRGLALLRERVEYFGGVLRLETAPGKGTSVEIEMPF